jgi:signal transduction histidine kinase
MFNVTLEHISQGVCFFDGSARLVLCNPRFATLYDLSPEITQPGTPLKEIVEHRYIVGSCPDMTPDEYIAWRMGIHKANTPRESELRLRNGKIMRIRHHQLEGGGWVGTHEDITESTRIADMLHQAQKLEAVGRLTGGIAHDFNNLLQTIGTALEMTAMSEHLAADPRLAELVADAQVAVTHGGQLTQQLLTFSRKQVLRPSLVNVVDLLDAMRGLLRQACGDSILLSFAWDTGPFPCLLDVSQFQSAALNLVINARDAMPTGGSLTITVETVVIEGIEAAASGIPDGVYINLNFIDVGQGISPDDLPRVFEPFFTTKKFGDGNGLGLAQVYGFAHQAGGSVVIISAPAKGTTVSLLLPMADLTQAPRGQHG